MQEPTHSPQRDRNRNILLFGVLLTLTIYADQHTKQTAIRLLENVENITFFNEIITFTLVENHGGFLGIVSSYPEKIRFLLLYVGVAILLGCCLLYIFLGKGVSRKYTLPLVFVTGGGISNLLDRIFNNGGVIDFVSIGIGQIRTGIFNLADVFILSGSFILGYLLFFHLDDEKRSKT